MDTQTIEIAVKQFEKWHTNHLSSTRLQKHETMKAILFGLSHAILEYRITAYHNDKNGLIDYVDRDSAIEIDDGPNEKSIRKLLYMRGQGKQVFWILVLSRGLGGKARREAGKASIPVMRILARNNNHFSYSWIS